MAKKTATSEMTPENAHLTAFQRGAIYALDLLKETVEVRHEKLRVLDNCDRRNDGIAVILNGVDNVLQSVVSDFETKLMNGLVTK